MKRIVMIVVILAAVLVAGCIPGDAAVGPDAGAVITDGVYSVALECVSNCDDGPPLDGVLTLEVEGVYVAYEGDGWRIFNACSPVGPCLSCGGVPLDEPSLCLTCDEPPPYEAPPHSDEYELCPGPRGLSAMITWGSAVWAMHATPRIQL